MFGMDPIYMVVLAIGGALSFGAQFWVKSRFKKWSQVSIANGMTGREVAEAILRAEGITDVGVEPVRGFLTDHYSPGEKKLRLSEPNFASDSIAAAGIAAHEVGHAIQHAKGYWPMQIRQRMVPVANIGTNIGVWMVVIGGVIGMAGLAKIGVLLFGGFVLFTLVTLPVEFDASSRAKKCLEQNQILASEQEIAGVRSVLAAAASTYLAAAVSAVLQLLYWAMRAGLSRR